jgi:SAM-dependent methyltransferase
MATPAPIEQVKAEAFMHQTMADLSSAIVTVMCTLGDRLGLFKELALHGPATSSEFAARASVNARYAQEWLSALASAGYLAYDATSGRFALPLEHAAVLAHENGPWFLGGLYQQLPALLAPLDQLTQAFRRGGGIPQRIYDQNLREGMARFTRPWFEHLLVPHWLTVIPEVQTRLARGARVADVGCGHGWALITLAQAFPRSYYIGYDACEAAIARARTNAEVVGVAERVHFRACNVIEGLPEQYDLITAFDVMHEMIDPRGALRAVRQALRSDGTFLMLERNCQNTLEANAGPLGALFYGISVLYCLPTSLAHGGEGLGTMGLPESKVHELCAEAGFSGVRRLPLEHPYNVLYEVKP